MAVKILKEVTKTLMSNSQGVIKNMIRIRTKNIVKTRIKNTIIF